MMTGKQQQLVKRWSEGHGYEIEERLISMFMIVNRTEGCVIGPFKTNSQAWSYIQLELSGRDCVVYVYVKLGEIL